MAKILMVDDSRTSRKILKDILIDAGFEISGEASNGEEGYQMYSEQKPDLVTMDITMPILDGIGALKKIRSDYPDARVVMVTAAGQKSKLIEAIQCGAIDFISKPFDNEKLVEIINKALG
ncbi:MAG: response regulator [Lachnospiraceae bacterium]|nr:response regulator [Lachnospiraceae bacterium]